MFDKISSGPALSERLANTIRKKIVNHYQIGQRLPTTKAIAEQFQCSINSAHHALAILRREGLIEGRTGRGTYVAGNVPGKHVALIIGLSEQYPNLSYYSGRILTETMAELRRQEVAVRTYWDFEGQPDGQHVGIESNDAPTLWNNLDENKVAAIGVIQRFRESEKNLRLAQCEVPVIWNTSVPGGYWVVNDFEGMLRQGIDSLVSEGARRIAVVAWDEDQRIAKFLHPWAHILKSLFASHSLELRQEWIRGSLEPSESGAGYEEFREIWSAFSDKPDGLFVTDDILMPDVALAIRELGIKVPDDLHVVAAANKGCVTSPQFPATRILSDPSAYALSLGKMLAALARKEELTQRQIIIPFQKDSLFNSIGESESEFESSEKERVFENFSKA